MENDEKCMRPSLLSWIGPCEVAHCTNCCSYFEGRFLCLLARIGMLEEEEEEKKFYLVTDISGLKVQQSAQLDQIRFRITNWNNLFFQFCYCGNVLTEHFIGQVLATGLQHLGQYCGCHGHREGNSPVSRRWMQ